MTALFFAFSLISVPAYVAMSTGKDDLDDVDIEAMDAADYDDGPYFRPSVHGAKLSASAPAQKAPISGFFERVRLKRLM